MAIPPVDLKTEFKEIGQEVSKRVSAVMKGGRYVLGDQVRTFENNFAKFTQAKHALGVANGSDALLLALMAFNVKAGDEILTTPFTFIATVTAIARLGAKPVFVDIEPESFNINPELIESRITKRTRGIIVVHLYGNPCRMDRIMKIAKAHKLFVIEDCAQACGTTFRGRSVGTFGDIGTFSFYPTKTLGAFGDGGAVTTGNTDLFEKLKSLHLHGEDGKFHSYRHALIGINSRLDEIQAAILNVKLKHLNRWNKLRRKAAEKYNKLLGNLSCSAMKFPTEVSGGYHVYHQYTLRTTRRDQLLAHLRSEDVYAGVYYPLPMHFQPCFEYLGYKEGDFPESERASREVLSLPIYPQIISRDQVSIAKKIQSFLK